MRLFTERRPNKVLYSAFLNISIEVNFIAILKQALTTSRLLPLTNLDQWNDSPSKSSDIYRYFSSTKDLLLSLAVRFFAWVVTENYDKSANWLPHYELRRLFQVTTTEQGFVFGFPLHLDASEFYSYTETSFEYLSLPFSDKPWSMKWQYFKILRYLQVLPQHKRPSLITYCEVLNLPE